MQTKHCIQCDEKINITATFCPFCTAKQPVVETSDVAGQNDIKEEKKTIARVEYPKRTDINDVVLVEKEEETKVSKEKQHQEKVEQEKEEEKLKYIAYHDELTGLKNRQAFKERIDTLSQKEACIGSIDANNLKKINDTMGHKYGDELLSAIANALSECFGEENVYRMGGDEFEVVLEGERSGSVDEKVERFHQLLEEKEEEMEHKFEITASVGFAYGDGILSVKEIMDQADSKMYEDKKQKKEEDKTKAAAEEYNAVRSNNATPLSGVKYNPNADGYYNDVKVIEEEEDVKLSNEVILKAAGIVVGAIVLFVIYMILI